MRSRLMCSIRSSPECDLVEYNSLERMERMGSHESFDKENQVSTCECKLRAITQHDHVCTTAAAAVVGQVG